MKVYLFLASFLLLDVLDDPAVSKCGCSDEETITYSEEIEQPAEEEIDDSISF